MSDLLRKLDDECLSLIIMNQGVLIFSSSKEGMLPLLEVIEKIDASKLLDSIVVDKMVGKAAALLICIFKAKKLYTKIMSLKAIQVLDEYGIEYSTEKIIPDILNKFGTDICPFEKTVYDTNSPEEGYKRLQELAKNLKKIC